jgi:hypothetical protein
MLDCVSEPAAIPVENKGKRVSCRAFSESRKNDPYTTYRVFFDQEHNIVRSGAERKGFLCVQGVYKLWIDQ